MNGMNLLPYMEDGRLFDYAASCARTLRPDGEGGGKALWGKLNAAWRDCERCHALLARRFAGSTRIPEACEWLLDNHYLLSREIPALRRELKSAARQRSSRGELLIVELSRMLLQAGNGRLTQKRCARHLAGFESVTPLRRRELLLFPAALRAALLEALAPLYRRLAENPEAEGAGEAMAALFTSLRTLAGMDTEALLDEADVSSRILAEEAAGVYARMDRPTKQAYLDRLERLARREEIEEPALALRLRERADREGKHVGFLLFPERRGRGGGLYIAALALLTLLSAFALRLTFGRAAGLLLLLPLWSLYKGFLDFLLLRLVRPRYLPRMDAEAGVPPEGQSLCVVSALLGCYDVKKLEELRLLSRREGRLLRFGLLADLPAAKERHRPEDAALLEAAEAEIKRLNEKYGGGFYLFTRERSFDGESWCGRERKRGALCELAKLLCGEPSALAVTGDREALKGTRYILSLDADTRVMPGALGELIAAALHPLNPYGILHPRIETELESATATDFALIFAGPGGSDPYGGVRGELYMDAFDCGGFAGKGLLEARRLLEASRRIPEGRVLSHDALEGALLHGGYVSDAAVSDAFPVSPLAYFKRQHRWVRGDWQNAPWILRPGIRAMDRFRLLDSLFRSLLAPATLAAILPGFFLDGAGLTIAGLAALLSLAQELLLALAVHRVGPGARLRRYSRVLSGAGGAILRCFLRLWLLPFEAWVNLTAALTALWRMAVSHRRLLEWQTFAELKTTTGLAAHVRAMWPAVALGVLLMALSPVTLGKSAGLMWLLSPAAAAALALPSARCRSLSARDRELLLSSVTEAYAYYRTLCAEEDSFLPPDNFQQSPPLGPAHRTSPTNIGLAMASAAALGETGVIPRAEARNLLGKMTASLERMERFRGHFYNWYDTRTLRPLRPKSVSTVDSGNLCAGLICARAALLGWGEEALAGRLGALIDEMDFAPLYDKKRALFTISYDPEEDRPVGGHYDLMASEAMLTSYLAVARGQAPLRHWRRLSRAQLQKDGYRGLASWTGTMFEYLMPALFLPLYPASLLQESARFCTAVQRKRRLPGRPWGLSESAFAALDAGGSYRYKAHGCPELALRRGMDADLVVAPYASFLALAVEPEAAAKNLRLLRRLGVHGRWGYFEAVDYSDGPEGEIVRCWMAHHVGMSILAAVNALEDGAVRRLFLSDPAMSAYTLLLQEKLPEDGAILRREKAPVPERPAKPERACWQLAGDGSDTGRAALLSNGVYHLRVKSGGESMALWGETCVYRAEDGLRLLLDGKTLRPVSWQFTEDSALWRYETENLGISLERRCAMGESGEALIVSAASQTLRHLRLTLAMTPLLCRLRDWDSHSAYWRLGLEAEERAGRLLLRRLDKHGEGECFLALGSDRPLRLQADRDGGLGALSWPELQATAELNLEAGEEQQLRFALCLARKAREALEGLDRALREDAPGRMVSAAARRLGMSREEVGLAMEKLPALWENRLVQSAPKRELWRWGLSGERPLLCAWAGEKHADSLLRVFCLLKACGVETELVFFSREAGEYRRPAEARLEGLLRSFGLEALLNAEGGLRFLPPEAEAAVKSREARPAPLPALPAFRLPPRGKSAPEFRFAGASFVFTLSPALPPRVWQLVLSDGRIGAFATEIGPAGLWWENARETRLIPPLADVRARSCPERLFALVEGRRVSLFADGLMPCTVRYAPGLAQWEKEIAGRRIVTSLYLAEGARLLHIAGAEGLSLCWEMEVHAGGPDGACVQIQSEKNLVRLVNPECPLPHLAMLVTASEPCRIEDGFCPAALRLSFTGKKTSVLAIGCQTRESLERAMEAPPPENGTEGPWSRLRVTGLSPALRHLLQPWAAYQCRVGRMLARASLYQSGGAVGFRDQLQDAVNLLLPEPSLAREQILDCCRHQYREGDVLHWWHRNPGGDRGVRTRCSDDLLWLVWALCETCEATGETDLCYEKTPWLVSEPLQRGERDRYETAAVSGEEGSVLEHAFAALDCCRRRGFGAHGLPFIGSGDWNDGLDRVGGESVWLGWFLSCCAERFASLLDALHDPRAGDCRRLAEAVGRAADRSFNGRWYPRAWDKEGKLLGGAERIDSLAQSWAAFCPYAAREHAEAALDSALARLVDRKNGLILLSDPPYGSEESPGYLSGYGRGYRENGGQYTHAAIWLALAAFRLGRRETGTELLRMLLPETRDLSRYEAEPFVLPADVSHAPGREGLAGWTWYTGSAGWFYRAATQELLGVRRVNGKIIQTPAAIDRAAWTFT